MYFKTSKDYNQNDKRWCFCFQEELESMALSDVLELKAVMDTEVFNSLLTVSVKPRRKKTTTVFMFQCDDIRVRTNIRELTLL